MSAPIAWRYLPKGKVKHALPLYSNSVTGHSHTSLCGLCPEDWLGTGSQDEYEKAEVLPECGLCVRILRLLRLYSGRK